jgi:hypothetical protein
VLPAKQKVCAKPKNKKKEKYTNQQLKHWYHTDAKIVFAKKKENKSNFPSD